MACALTGDITAISADDYEKFFAKSNKPLKTREELYERIPHWYKERVKVFDPKEANDVPPHRDIDHSIDLMPGAKPPAKKAYGLSREQAQVVKSYIDDMLGKGIANILVIQLPISYASSTRDSID